MVTAIIGDLHASDTKPKSRMDDYPTTCIDKLESVLKLYNTIFNFLVLSSSADAYPPTKLAELAFSPAIVTGNSL